ncbi:bifunctional adenosylcobinamide kinase/adenosylcobinamide-phosphate guanylyltransferase [Thalassobaculum litoreum]|uniref:Bifunctional adenosylcobalamin biosynthesis protein n=1 Tax=Thalassobaculum litoreum DSM 18839 TaxID=1123362 RepID=A0A8G2BFH5_9PROT|nr:bifunctional adenosylcobinamide kinase/adenosylcobinamide-phosphate guanylyltransferase [Thalassobaculum litoreum]SDF38918.1 adenosylcobinamide kinase /adenosylcobinamide-phosphate guanylyltransferase [Thalassobaculum litoreum DSM 18839]
MTLTLILGGARSGKSRRAEALARETGLEGIYLATAEPMDADMAARIAKHREDRAAHGWTTVEEPLALAAALAGEARPGRMVLVECLTTWLTNLMVHGRDLEAATAEFLAWCAAPTGPAILVSNEVGFGIVPEHKMARDFRDHAGRLHQRVAEHAARVELVVAGIPMTVKG